MHAPTTDLVPAHEPAYDWSGWEKWLQGHLAIQHATITEEFIETCGYALGVKANELHDGIAALETQLNALKRGCQQGRQARPAKCRQ